MCCVRETTTTPPWERTEGRFHRRWPVVRGAGSEEWEMRGCCSIAMGSPGRGAAPQKKTVYRGKRGGGGGGGPGGGGVHCGLSEKKIFQGMAKGSGESLPNDAKGGDRGRRKALEDLTKRLNRNTRRALRGQFLDRSQGPSMKVRPRVLRIQGKNRKGTPGGN